MRTLLQWLPRSLSTRVFWLTVAIIFAVDSLVMMPGMGREWHAIVSDRVTQAELFAILIKTAGPGSPANAQIQAAQRGGTIALTLIEGDRDVSLLPGAAPQRVERLMDFNHFGRLQDVLCAERAVLGLAPPYLQITTAFPLPPASHIEIILSQAPVAAHMRRYAGHMILFALVVAVITGGLVYALLHRLLVEPMRIVTAEIIAFRRDPEYARLGGLKWLAAKPDREIAGAARELVIMQGELRTALWRNAQLAALGTAVAKISHDLRNILASALLVAERLQRSGDAAIAQAADTLINSIERAADLVRRAMVDAGGQAPPVARSHLVLRELVDEVGDVIRQGEGAMAIDNRVPGSLVLSLDRSHIYRVLANLLRNAAQAGATRAILRIEEEAGVTLLVVTDNGPGLPRKALASLFQPFAGSSRNGGTGLGLTIARDLIRAHGGDLLLRLTGAGGTEFVMSLPDTDIEETV